MVEQLTKNKLASVFLFILAISTALFASGIRFERMNRYQGFPADSVNALFQDRYGFIWVGCDEGLLRYDGQSFRVFRPPADSVSGTGTNFNVSSIIQDSSGRFWIGTFGSGLFTLDPRSESFSPQPYLPESHFGQRFFIYRLMQDTKGAIWISSWGFGLSRYDPKKKTFSHFPAVPGAAEGITNPFIRQITERNDGSIWFGSGDGLVCRYNTAQNSFTRFQLHENGKDEKALKDIVFSLLFDSDDDLWVGTLNSGLWHCRIHGETLEVLHHFKGGQPPQQPGDNHIRDLIETSQLPGQIWICTDYGLYMYSKKSRRFSAYLANPNDSFSLSRNYLSCIFEDRTGLLWLGTINGGLMKFSPHSNPFNTAVPQLQDDRRSHSEVTSLLRLDEERLLLGGLASTVTLIPFRSISSGKLSGEQIALSGNELNSNRIFALAKDPNDPDTIQIGTTWSGLKKLTITDRIYKITSEEFALKNYQNNSANTVNDILVLGRNETWYATNDGLFIAKNGKVHQWTNRNSDGALPGNRIFRLFHDGEGLVWIGTQFGLSLYSSKSETFLPLVDHLEVLQNIRSIIRCFHKSANGGLWIGTNNGLYRFPKTQGGELVSLNHQDGLASNQVYSMESDKNGHLWIGTAQGLSRYDPISRRFFNYDIDNGLDNHMLVCSYYEPDEDLMVFGGINGLTIFRPHQIRPTPYPPAILLTGFETISPEDGTTIPLQIGTPPHLTEKIVLKQGMPLIIHFSAMDFSAPRKNQYQFRMLGFDAAWHFTSSQRQQAHFHALPPGKYQFQVKGSNSDGVWNARGTSLNIEITAPWWKSPVFLFMAASLTLLSIVLVYRNRLRIVSYRKTEKEKLKIFFDANSISQREIEIIELIVAGHSNKEIEDILYISLPTVKSHIYHIFKKLNVSSRSQLLALINRIKGLQDNP